MTTLKQLQEKGEKEFDILWNEEDGEISIKNLCYLKTFLHQQTTLAFEAGKEEAIADYQTNYEQKHIVSAIDLKEKETLAMVLKEIENFSNRNDDEILKDIGKSSEFPAPCSRKTCNLLADTLKTKLQAKE